MAKPPSPYIKCPVCMRYVLRTDADHTCIPSTIATLTAGLSPDLRDAWRKLRAFAEDLGPQKIYPSPNTIVFARGVCYFFVKPRPTALETHLFLPEPSPSPYFKKVHEVSRSKHEHTVLLRHPDEIEEPLTDYLRHAWNHAAR